MSVVPGQNEIWESGVCVVVVPDKRAKRARSGTHNHRTWFCESWSDSESNNHALWLWAPAFRGDDIGGRRRYDRFASSRNACTASNSFSRFLSMMMLWVPSASAT